MSSRAETAQGSGSGSHSGQHVWQGHTWGSEPLPAASRGVRGMLELRVHPGLNPDPPPRDTGIPSTINHNAKCLLFCLFKNDLVI